MVFEFLKLNIDVTDDYFNSIYPEAISLLARKHWTSVSVAKSASEYLVERPGARVLDIGSGAGKFCLVGASHTKGHFTGVEQRFKLVELSRKLAESYSVRNAKFINGNINAIDFKSFDSFYFFNSFYENIDTINRIDDEVCLDTKLYHQYSTYIVGQFTALPLGARLATYCSPFTIIPSCFKLQDSLSGGTLRFWEKIEDNKAFA
ncbi:MAG: methyltransferase domain-containing protein [Bacteroidota bacterium]